MKKDAKKVTLENIAGLIRESHEGLARSVAKGFEEVNKEFAEVHKEFGEVHKELKGIHQKIEGTNNRIDRLVDDKVSWDAHTRLAGRVTRLENSARFQK